MGSLRVGNPVRRNWNNDTVKQGQAHTDEIAPGYEQLATTLANLIADLPRIPLKDDDAAEVRSNAETVLAEVVNEEPDRGAIKRYLTMIKGFLSPAAAEISKAATAESAELARKFIHS